MVTKFVLRSHELKKEFFYKILESCPPKHTYWVNIKAREGGLNFENHSLDGQTNPISWFLFCNKTCSTDFDKVCAINGSWNYLQYGLNHTQCTASKNNNTYFMICINMINHCFTFSNRIYILL